MTKFFAFSFGFHAILFALLIWSDKIQLEFLKSKNFRKDAGSVLSVNLTYKPSDTAMRLGKEKRDLPPPDVKIPPPAPDAPTLKEKKTEKVKERKTKKEADEEKRKIAEKKELERLKKSTKSILNKLKFDAKREDRPPPKIDNFPTHEKGEIGARGTGGRGQRILSPAEQALQSAMRRHFDLIDARNFRRINPNAEGYIEVSLIGVGSQFKIKSLRVLESTGFVALDQSCERAIRVAVDEESFALDVIQELNGKESSVLCQP